MGTLQVISSQLEAYHVIILAYFAWSSPEIKRLDRTAISGAIGHAAMLHSPPQQCACWGDRSNASPSCWANWEAGTLVIQLRGPHVFGSQAFIAPLDPMNPWSARCRTQPTIQPLTVPWVMAPFQIRYFSGHSFGLVLGSRYHGQSSYDPYNSKAKRCHWYLK